jgi:hypothetical protein
MDYGPSFRQMKCSDYSFMIWVNILVCNFFVMALINIRHRNFQQLVTNLILDINTVSPRIEKPIQDNLGVSLSQKRYQNFYLFLVVIISFQYFSTTLKYYTINVNCIRN